MATRGTLRRADGKRATGAILWYGISPIDGTTPIVCVATWGNGRAVSINTKTGGMVQTWILVDPRVTGLTPLEATRTGEDVGICGGCEHRGRIALVKVGRRLVARVVGRSCYVNLVQGPGSVASGVARGIYPDLSGDLLAIAELGRDATVRLGAYGDPAAVPAPTWRALVAHSAGHTGYTHQWKSARLASALRDIVQASCDSARDRDRARAAGWATFTVMARGQAVPETATLCPASAEAGKLTTCEKCLMCDGSGQNIVIHAHGSWALHVDRRKALPVLA
jgi:hypothetical protein